MEILVTTIVLFLAVYTFFEFDSVYPLLQRIYHTIKDSSYIPKETCDIITPLNTYSNVDCDTFCFYEDRFTFKFENDTTVQVSPSTAIIKYHDK